MSDEGQNVDKCLNVVSEVSVLDSGPSGTKRANEDKERKEDEPPDVAKKRQRGPSDCLD